MLWDKSEERNRYTISYIHRGAPEDIRRVNGTYILSVGIGHFEIIDGPNVTLIPFHRILSIKEGNKVLYRKIQGGIGNKEI
jgi:uncharacterized protein (UPF0248 family)